MAELKRHMDVLERVSERPPQLPQAPKKQDKEDSHLSSQANQPVLNDQKYTVVYFVVYTCVYRQSSWRNRQQQARPDGQRATR